MTQKARLKELLREVEGQNVDVKAGYLLDMGVRVIERKDDCDYASCPYVSADGKSCSILANMICKERHRTLPCGFFPPEARRRAHILDITGRNKIKPLSTPPKKRGEHEQALAALFFK